MHAELDPRKIRSTRYVEIGQIIERDAEALIERWSKRALEEQPNARSEYRAEMRNHLSRFLVALGAGLSASEGEQPSIHGIIAVEHGEQRWKSGWQLTEVVRDYQILRLVILEHLDTVLARPLEVREVMAIGLSLDEAIAAATVTYAAFQQAYVREHEERVRSVMQESNRALEEYSARAVAANHAKSDFLARMSHEVRTPMTAILGFAEELLGRVNEPSHLAAVETIKRNGEYLLEIINDILDLSKIEAGKLQVEPVPCSPAQVIIDVQSLMQVRAQAKGISLEVEYAGAIPETIRTDPVHLRQILINLVGNALKFTEAGSVRLMCRLISSGPNPALGIDVIDTGIGIPPDQIPHLYEPFSQADNSGARRFEGTGLGLPISKRLAEMLGGDIALESELGRGSTFSLTIATGPLAGIPLVDPRRVPHDSEQTPLPRQIHLDCRVLVADDRRDNQFLIKAILGKAGADVVVADNGKLAIQMVQRAEHQKRPFDIILMDMQMPQLDGYSAAKQLRSTGCRTPIIALTASAMAGDREKCLEAGCDDYTPKPIDRNHLIELVARFCRTDSGEDPDGGAAPSLPPQAPE